MAPLDRSDRSGGDCRAGLIDTAHRSQGDRHDWDRNGALWCEAGSPATFALAALLSAARAGPQLAGVAGRTGGAEWPAGPSRIDIKALAELTKQ